MPRLTFAIVGLLAATAATPILTRPAAADPPSLFASSLFTFPGSTANPASGTSAGLVLADRWLGDDPYSNPAWGAGLGVALSGTMLHVSRQDLRAGNRNFDETPAFFDGAGLAVGLPSLGRFGFSLYAFQPVLRLETNAFSRGTATPNPAAPPATIEATASARELRAGGGVSVGIGPVRVGGALEWTLRDDAYQVIESSGDPAAGTTRLELSGNAVGFQLGARLDHRDSSVGGVTVGLGIRRLPALAVDGPHSAVLLVSTSDSTLRAEREAGWELGASGRCVVSPSIRVLAALGTRTAQRWEGLDLAAGRAWEWKVASEYHDARDAWTLRFGWGQERQSDAAEPRADVIGLGFGWGFTWGIVDMGLAHRTLHRETGPRSFEDRVVLTVRAPR